VNKQDEIVAVEKETIRARVILVVSCLPLTGHVRLHVPDQKVLQLFVKKKLLSRLSVPCNIRIRIIIPLSSMQKRERSIEQRSYG
jgi:hypothetical protein